MSVLVYLLFVSILGIIVYGDSQKRFMAFFAGTVLFPNICLFIKSPSISPQHIILYLYLAVELIKFPDEFRKGLLRNPVYIPLLICCFSYFLTALFNKGVLSIDMYYGVRDFVDTFAYLIVAYIAGMRFSKHEFAKGILVFIVVCCFFGIAEGMLNANYPHKFIGLAFPKYDGLYNLDSSISLSQNWRIRTCFTTKHPTAFATLLMTMFLFYLPYLKEQIIERSKVILVLSLLGINILLCGSRTGIVCVLLGIFLYVIDKLNIILKIFIWGMLLFSSSLILAFMLSQFAHSTGSGSSLDFRTRQLIFSIVTIEDSPIFGNGNNYASHNLFEENDKGQMRIEDESGTDMGGLESMVFKLLIDRGFVGLLSYYLLLAWLLVFFYWNRNKFERNDAFVNVIVGTAFLTLSGSIGNSSSFIFTILGLELGHISRLKKEHEDAEDEQRLKAISAAANNQKVKV